MRHCCRRRRSKRAMKHPHDKPQGKSHKKRPHFEAVSLQKFGGIGKSTYDKRAKQEKERALNAAVVNKYKKIQKRMEDKLHDEPRDQAGDGSNAAYLGNPAKASGQQAVQQGATAPQEEQQVREQQQVGEQQQQQTQQQKKQEMQGSGTAGGTVQQHGGDDDREQLQRLQQQGRLVGSRRGDGGSGTVGGRGGDGGRGRGNGGRGRTTAGGAGREIGRAHV